MKKITLLMTMLLFAVAGFAQVNLTNGLLAYYPYSGNANDASGNGANGTVNSATLTTDRFNASNSAYSFNSNTIIANFNHNLDNDIAIVYWFKTSSNSAMGMMNFYGNNFTGGTTDSYLRNQLNGTSFTIASKIGEHETFSGCTEESEASVSSGGTNYADSSWHMISVEISGTTLNMYIDTVLVASDVITDSCGISYDATEFTMGYAGAQTFVGQLDDVMAYSRTLTADERAYLYNRTSTWTITGTEKTASVNTFSVKVAPNPATSSTQLVLPTADSYQINITDLTGRLVYSLQSKNTQNLDINTAAWPAGIYMVQVRDTKGGMSVTKLVKE
jgi:hypothetical protein